MKKEVILEKLKKIFEMSEIEELNPELIPELIPVDSAEGEIGAFFVLDQKMYVGTRCGDPEYCAIGKTDDLKAILCRTYKEDKMLEIIFEFPSYRVLVFHETDIYVRIGVFDSKKNFWVMEDQKLQDAFMIEKCIENILESENIKEEYFS